MASNEEADGILVLTLQQIGCPLPEEVTSISDFATEVLVRAVSHCLHVIGDESAADYSKMVLPKEMSARFRVCTQLADTVKKLGFKQEIGFHQFLYPSDKSSRDLFAFLLERLPQAQNLGGGDLAEGASALRRNISTAIAARRSEPPLPPTCRPRSLRGALAQQQAWGFPSVAVAVRPLRSPPGGKRSALDDATPFVWEQTRGPHALAPAVFEANAAAADRGRDAMLEAETPEEARARRAAFDKGTREALAAALASGRAADSLAQLIEGWGGAGGASLSRLGRAAEFGQERGGDIAALDAELTREERLRLAAEEREARLAREEAEREAAAGLLRAQLDEANAPRPAPRAPRPARSCAAAPGAPAR